MDNQNAILPGWPTKSNIDIVEVDCNDISMFQTMAFPFISVNFAFVYSPFPFQCDSSDLFMSS